MLIRLAVVFAVLVATTACSRGGLTGGDPQPFAGEGGSFDMEMIGPMSTLESVTLRKALRRL